VFHGDAGRGRNFRRERTQAPLRAAGISLGGNALLRWAQEAGEAASAVARAVASVSLMAVPEGTLPLTTW
jgi:predicted alpha/beta-fold hydrolase